MSSCAKIAAPSGASENKGAGRTSAGCSLHLEHCGGALRAGSAHPLFSSPATLQPSVSPTRVCAACSPSAWQPFAWQADPLQPPGAVTSSKSSSANEHILHLHRASDSRVCHYSPPDSACPGPLCWASADVPIDQNVLCRGHYIPR